MKISILIVNMTDEFTSRDYISEIHQRTQKHVNVQHRDIELFAKLHNAVHTVTQC